MDRGRFWSMIDAARQASGGDVRQQAELLEEELRRLPLAEVASFHRILADLQAESFNVNLWAPPWPSPTGVSTDGFFGFRGWLVAQGQRTYEAAVANPDSRPTYPTWSPTERCRGLSAYGSSQPRSIRS